MSEPNFDPNDNNAYLVYIPSAVFVVVCPLLMGLRIWARVKKGGGLGADDWTAIAALVSGPDSEANHNGRVSVADHGNRYSPC